MQLCLMVTRGHDFFLTFQHYWGRQVRGHSGFDLMIMYEIGIHEWQSSPLPTSPINDGSTRTSGGTEYLRNLLLMKWTLQKTCICHVTP